MNLISFFSCIQSAASSQLLLLLFIVHVIPSLPASRCVLSIFSSSSLSLDSLQFSVFKASCSCLLFVCLLISHQCVQSFDNWSETFLCFYSGDLLVYFADYLYFLCPLSPKTSKDFFFFFFSY